MDTWDDLRHVKSDRSSLGDLTFRANVSYLLATNDGDNDAGDGHLLTERLIDTDVVKDFADVRYNGHLEFAPISRFYGLLVTELKQSLRQRLVDFVQREFAGFFVFGIHSKLR